MGIEQFCESFDSNRGVAKGGPGGPELPPLPECGRSVNPIQNRVGRFCTEYYFVIIVHIYYLCMYPHLP